ncbi:MAG: M23 family metallopeptidase [Candidatus Cloacimonetes bacterium]|nr:M23 family metallopeptidase [Candidatus Cloacimonadota bacterium]
MELDIERKESGEVCIRLKRRGLIAAAVITTLTLILLIITSIYLHRVYTDVRHAQQILLENSILRDRIFVLNTELDSIMIKLELMERWEDEIRSRENYREINKEVRDMGIGGLPQIDQELSLSDADLQLEYSMLTTRFMQLRGKAYFDFETHQELFDNLNLRDDLYSSTPSIYPTFGRLSSGFGNRTHPITGKRDFHSGIDLSNKTGTPIYATADGVISSVGWKRKLGKFVKIKHNFGFNTVYGHMNKYNVKKGDKVHKGEIIGEMGSTGETTGSHLHYEVIRYNRHRNPAVYLAQERKDIALK